MLGLGDSTLEGVGADPTFDPENDDGLHFGGVDIPDTVTFVKDGVLQSVWPDNGGAAGANPGMWPHLAAAALLAGFTHVHIVAYSTSGNTTSVIRLTEHLGANNAAHYLTVNGITPDLVVVSGGSNDSQPAENAAFEGSSFALANDLDGAYPNARKCWLEPIADAEGSYTEADLVRADIEALLSGRPLWFRIPGAGRSGADDVHPSLQTYADWGEETVDGYLNDVD